MTVDLAPLFAPRRVAVLGVSRSPEKLGHRLLRNLLDWEFPGQVFPVNPSGEPILGLPSVPRVGDLPEDLDLALVSLPAVAVVEALRGLGARRCRAAVVLASGFGETGEAGRVVQAELARTARETGMRIVGPNCMGVVNVPGRLGAGIPVLPTPERAVRAYRALRAHAGRRQEVPPAPRPLRALPAEVARGLAEGGGPLGPALSRALLERYGLAFPSGGTAASIEDALSLAGRIGYPVVVKTARPDVAHKTEAGGVVLGIGSDAALREAAARVLARFGPGLLIQRQVEPGVEFLAGGWRDPVFGPTVAFGLGGVLAELWGEVAIGLAPLGSSEAAHLLRSGRAAALVRGFRGSPPCDEGRLAAVLAGVGDLLVDHPEIVELDVNPLVARGAEAIAVDALIIVDHTADGGRRHA